ncbi:GGDEF domain-containing protein [Salinisphaera sp. T31B1]|uniref:GGDEF domain-containing protein n=1 Tax=Salinisphaera sp. T31B1 TaxID=727963 RepID=UPI00333FB1E0
MPRVRDHAIDPVERIDNVRGAPWMIGAIRRQLDRGFGWLRFEPALEREFVRYLNRSARNNRMALLAIGALTLLIAPVLDRLLFNLPTDAMTAVRLVQYVGMIPVLLGALAWCWWRPLAQATELVMAGQFVCISLGLIATRVLLNRHGVDFPIEFISVSFIGLVALGRIRAWVMIPTGAALAVGVLLAETLLVQPQRPAYYHMAAAGTLALLAGYIQYASEHFLRGSWLDRRLLQLVSRRDGLTGLFNRTALESALTVGHAHAVREGVGYGLAMIDIDEFGSYNNAYGHPVGDRSLREVAQMIESYARRPLDVCGRYGGEEFTVLWIDNDPARLAEHADNLRSAIQALHIPHKRAAASAWLTVSIGMCYVSAPEPDDSLSAVLATADRLLFEAKRGGRNQVVNGVYKTLSKPA